MRFLQQMNQLYACIDVLAPLASTETVENRWLAKIAALQAWLSLNECHFM